MAILPFTEQQAFYEELRPGEIPLKGRYKPGASADDMRLLQNSFPMLHCPSDIGRDLTDNMKFGGTDHFRVGLSNYIGCAGWSTPYPTHGNDSAGMLWGSSYLGLRDCVDGTSNTFLVSERDYIHHAATWPGVGRNDAYGNEATLRKQLPGQFLAPGVFRESVRRG